MKNLSAALAAAAVLSLASSAHAAIELTGSFDGISGVGSYVTVDFDLSKYLVGYKIVGARIEARAMAPRDHMFASEELKKGSYTTVNDEGVNVLHHYEHTYANYFDSLDRLEVSVATDSRIGQSAEHKSFVDSQGGYTMADCDLSDEFGVCSRPVEHEYEWLNAYAGYNGGVAIAFDLNETALLTLNTFQWASVNASVLDGYFVEGSFKLVLETEALAPGGGVGGVPEPSTWALTIGGFGLAGGVLRRRRVTLA